jgi:osmotically-inducible protein OsmY
MMKFRTQKLITLAVLSASMVTALSACAPMIIGGAVVGSMMAIDRRTTGTQIEDEGIELRAASALRTTLGDRVHVNITSFNRQVLLTGEALTPLDRQQVEQVVGKVENVRAVVNEVAVMGHTSLSQRSSDVLVTSKVKAGLVDARDMSVNAFKVVTERGTTYLMGRVTKREADRATEIARSTSGVLKVVRVLELISEEELRALQPAPAQASKPAM